LWHFAGLVVFYTAKRRLKRCEACQRGVCVQKVMRWADGLELVQHEMQDELN